MIELINKNIANCNTYINDEIIKIMLENIGSIDPVLRDKTIYMGFYNLFNDKKISIIQKEYILNYILEHNLLNLKIEKNDDFVFTRSFVSLLLVLIIEDHFDDAWIDDEIQNEIIKYVINYFENEKDARGYVKNKGWAMLLLMLLII